MAPQYFDASPSTPSKPAAVRLVLPDLTLDLRTDRGVFAADGVDPGTKLLLLVAPPPEGPAPVVLDLGCGYGPVAVTVARRNPGATVWAVDVNERARALCTANAEMAGVGDRVRVVAPDDVPVDVVFDELWSNPPIRIGKPALHELLTGWLARLAPTGVAHLVVHKHLGSDSLAAWLTGQGWHVHRLESRGGYRVLDVSRAETGA